MNGTLQQATELEFSEKYDEKHAHYYFEKHEQDFWWRTYVLRVR